MDIFVGVLFYACFMLSHGDLDQRILEKTNQIASSPLNQELYLERGELYLLHEEYLKAKFDFSFCLDHKLTNSRVFLGMSKSHLYLNHPDTALLFVDNVLAIEKNHLAALELKASILSRLEKYCEAAGTLERLITLAEHPSPALFLDASKNWDTCSETGSNQNAIRILEDGIRQIGAIGVIQKHLVSAYKRSGRYDEAVILQTTIIEQSDLKIRAYYERAQLYVEMHLPDKAKEDLSMTLSLIDRLPEHKKSLSSIENMRLDAIVLLTELKK